MRIQRLPQRPLSHGARKRMALAGAQHKLALVLREGQLYEPEATQPSTHLLKPDHPSADDAHSVVNEWFVMRLAAALGLQVPAVTRRYVPEPTYLIERFDREDAGTGMRRRHVIDACQLLNPDRSYKYSRGSMAVLAPHDDLLSTAVYETVAMGGSRWPATAELAWPVQGWYRFADLDVACLLAAAAELGLARQTAMRLLRQMLLRIEDAAAALLAELEREPQGPPRASGPGRQGKLRCLRAIVHVVIHDSVLRLRQGL